MLKNTRKLYIDARSFRGPILVIITTKNPNETCNIRYDFICRYAYVLMKYLATD